MWQSRFAIIAPPLRGSRLNWVENEILAVTGLIAGSRTLVLFFVNGVRALEDSVLVCGAGGETASFTWSDMKSIRCVRNEEKHMNARHGAGGEPSLKAKMEVSKGKVKIRFIVNGNATKSLWGRRLETFQGHTFVLLYSLNSWFYSVNGIKSQWLVSSR